MFRTVLVLDIKDGKVVHAVRGERGLYEAIHSFSTVVNTSNPIEILDELKASEVYIADLDSLMGEGNNRELIERIRCKRMLDCGVTSIKDVSIAQEIADTVVLGTETASLDLIKGASDLEFNISVSIDMKEGGVLTSDEKLRKHPLALVGMLNDFKLADLIVLDLSRVGTKSGIDFEYIGKIVEKSRHPVLVGGGVRSVEDLDKLAKIGVEGALVATAVHDGSMPPSMLRCQKP